MPIHIIQRGNNRNTCFFNSGDYQVYLGMLAESAKAAGCRLHAYVLMTNHIHVLATPESTSSPAVMMKSVGERYTQYANRRYERSGTLWQGRYRSCLVDSERYFLICQRYIELNPVRARMVGHPADYEWSSYRNNAHGQTRELITPHEIYVGLGTDDLTRQKNYRALFEAAIPETVLQQMRSATNGNGAFGDDAFVGRIGQVLGRNLWRQSRPRQTA
jgi:putative transposase